jgi:thiol-disulfide isomerase/thioredoxin
MRQPYRLAAGLVGAAMLIFWGPTPLRAAADRLRKAPAVALKTIDGRSVKLADEKGRIVIIDFWASWCAPCKATFPALNALAEDLRPQGVDVLAISEDEKRQELDLFLAEFHPTIAVLLDGNGRAAGSFGVTAIPSMYVIDRDGMIRFSHPNYGVEVLDAVKREIATLTPPPG